MNSNKIYKGTLRAWFGKFSSIAALLTLSKLLTIDALAQTAQEDIAAFVLIAKNNITRDFKDPQSAQFRGLFVSKNGPMFALCGEVNAKNSYGAYVGFKKFFATSEPMLQQLAGKAGDTYVYEQMALGMCSAKVADVN